MAIDSPRKMYFHSHSTVAGGLLLTSEDGVGIKHVDEGFADEGVHAAGEAEQHVAVAHLALQGIGHFRMELTFH